MVVNETDQEVIPPEAGFSETPYGSLSYFIIAKAFGVDNAPELVPCKRRIPQFG